MFNDWQISHFHLGQVFQTPSRIGPRPYGRPLLFAHIKADHATLLDIQPHNSWSMQNLLRILRDTSPGDLPEVQGIVSSRNETLTDDHVAARRKQGANGYTEIDGRVFLSPGLGICSSGSALRLSRLADQIFIALEKLRTAIATNRLPMQTQMYLAGSIGVPVRLGLRVEAGALIVYEKVRGLTLITFRALE
jgi:hypothetical protein